MDKRASFGPHWARGCTAPRLVLSIRPGNAIKCASPWPWQRRACIFYVVFGWQCVENYEALVKECGFYCIGGGSVPNELPCVGLGDAPKRASPGLGTGLHGCFCVVYGWNCVKKQ